MAFPFKTYPGLAGLYVTALSVALLAVTAGAPGNWAVSLPDASHTYGIRFRTGADGFFTPPVGWFIDNGYKVCLALIALAIVAEVATRFLRPQEKTHADVDGHTSLRS